MNLTHKTMGIKLGRIEDIEVANIESSKEMMLGILERR